MKCQVKKEKEKQRLTFYSINIHVYANENSLWASKR